MWWPSGKDVGLAKPHVMVQVLNISKLNEQALFRKFFAGIFKEVFMVLIMALTIVLRY